MSANGNGAEAEAAQEPLKVHVETFSLYISFGAVSGTVMRRLSFLRSGILSHQTSLKIVTILSSVAHT